MMTARSLAHLGYVVPDLESAQRRFVREGGEVTIEPTVDPLQNVVVCLLRMDGAVDIELVAPLDAENNPVGGRLARGGGLDHICYSVDCLAEALASEEAMGSLVVSPPRPAVAFGRDVAFVHRRSGLVVELMTREETGHAVQRH